MKILCIGHSSWDMTVPVDDYPVENTKYRFSEKYSAGGGPASNAAYLLGKWGIETVIATTIGSDDFGTKIKKEFQDIKVNTEYIETNYEKETSFSFILINKKNGSRTVFNVATEHPALKKLNYDFTPDIIFTDGHDYGATQNAISKYQNAISVIDAGRITPELLELCKYIKYIVCSKGFAETVTGMKFDFNNPQSLVNIYTKLQDKYPNSNLTITLEEHGCLYTSGNEIKIMPGLKLTPVDTTGAGDIFHGAFTYGLANGFDMDKIVTFANIAAGLSVTKMGSRLSIPSLSEVMDYYNARFNVSGLPQTNNTGEANSAN
ncbi:kinase PfkB family [Clostridium sp. CAG:609]|nr:kinase PfkB family [Clostridium sp. CAG:609]